MDDEAFAAIARLRRAQPRNGDAMLVCDRLEQLLTRPGRPRVERRDKTLAATRPWEADGMSRRTWFRRQAERRRKGES